jgi:hypothetical protein
VWWERLDWNFVVVTHETAVVVQELVVTVPEPAAAQGIGLVSRVVLTCSVLLVLFVWLRDSED